jgi:hypothetical protein
MDQRKYARFRVELPVAFEWRAPKGVKRGHGGGFTRDISAEGVFISTSAPAPPVGSLCTYQTRLPWLEGNLPKLRMKALGRVVRAEGLDKTGVSGFAVHTTRFSLHTR